ncbi:ORF I polyprotein, partial [Chelydra serpentina]
MVTLATIIPPLDSRDWCAALDLQDAYFHITLHPAHRPFLRFTVGSNHYQYRVLPFGLSTAPCVFSKTLVVVAAYLRRKGVIIFPYLDDCLLKGASRQETTGMLKTTINLFHQLGLQINKKKSTLEPTQRLEFIGADLDSIQAKALLPNHRFMTLTNLISTVTISPQT